jgi:hypothetical protein
LSKAANVSYNFITMDYRADISLPELKKIEPFEDPEYYDFNYEEKLMGPVFDLLHQGQDEEEIFKALSRGQKYFFAITQLFSQVYNGGIGQFFWNHDIYIVESAIEGLEEIEAKEVSGELRIVRNQFFENKITLDNSRLKENFQEFVSFFYKFKIDDLIFAEAEQTKKLMVDYILRVPEEFIKL